MRKVLLFSCVVISMIAMAQDRNVPDWYDMQMRSMVYPRETFFVGFVRGELRNGESLTTAFERIKNSARAEAISSIRTTVEHTANQQTSSSSVTTMKSYSETVYETFLSTTKLSSKIVDIPELQVDAWYDRQNNIVAGFAWVKKSAACQYYQKQIQINMGKLRSAISVAEYLESNGEKIKARTELQKVEDLLPKIDEAIAWLPVYDCSESVIHAKMDERNELEIQLKQRLSNLSHATKLYIACESDFFGTDYSVLAESIKGQLKEVGCNFVTDYADADWVITIKSSAKESHTSQSGEYVTYFAYVDATISILKTATLQTVYSDALSMKGGHMRNYTEAARIAYKDISIELVKAIKAQIL